MQGLKLIMETQLLGHQYLYRRLYVHISDEERLS